MGLSESLIPEIVKFRELIESLSKLYSEIIALVDLEHQAIRTSELDEIEVLVRNKQELGDRVIVVAEEISGSFERVKSSVCSISSESVNEAVDLLGLVELLERVRLAEEGMEYRVFDHERSKLRKVFDEFKTLNEKYQPKIEMNRYLIRKLLHNHQETFRFWQSIAAESESTYGSTGATKQQVSQPTLKVRT